MIELIPALCAALYCIDPIQQHADRELAQQQEYAHESVRDYILSQGGVGGCMTVPTDEKLFMFPVTVCVKGASISMETRVRFASEDRTQAYDCKARFSEPPMKIYHDQIYVAYACPLAARKAANENPPELFVANFWSALEAISMSLYSLR